MLILQYFLTKKYEHTTTFSFTYSEHGRYRVIISPWNISSIIIINVMLSSLELWYCILYYNNMCCRYDEYERRRERIFRVECLCAFLRYWVLSRACRVILTVEMQEKTESFLVHYKIIVFILWYVIYYVIKRVGTFSSLDTSFVYDECRRYKVDVFFIYFIIIIIILLKNHCLLSVHFFIFYQWALIMWYIYLLLFFWTMKCVQYKAISI